MGKLIFNFGVTLIISIIEITIISSMPSPDYSVSYCNDACQSLDDCGGELICINGKCNDDPDVGTDVCRSGGGGGGGGTSNRSCQQVGTLTCLGRSYPTYDCSPPVTNATIAKLTFNHFSEGGALVSKCDGKVYSKDERIVAVSTGWYDNGSRCLKMIRITAGNGRSVAAKVVDECDSLNGCDEGHGGQPPCPNDIVDGSQAVWEALRLNQDQGIVDIIWSMA